MELNTRKDFEALMHKILQPLLPLYSPGGALLQLGDTGVTYPRRTIGMEGFSRPLWALAPYWLGGGQPGPFAEVYRRGLAAGADPDGPEYWGSPGDYDQLFVEMAAIACAILEVPAVVWEPLAENEKQNLARWLNTINTHELPHCNWLFFRVLVDLALDSVGMPCDLPQMERDLDEIDSWYVGDGWYTDGTPSIKPQRDYYIPWALQYYGVLYSVFAAKRAPARAERFRRRALEFGRQFAFWFDENGAALPYGRSLGYRFGQCAFYSACVFAGLEPLPLPVMKGIIVRNLQWWMEKPIFDRDGVLTIGYTYPQLYMSERYNAPGSPYWGMKSFVVLALPADHPFWSAEAAPLPRMPELYAMQSADLLFQRLPDGQVNAYAPAEVEQNEHGQFAEKYAKFVYNTRFGFSASRSYVQLEQAAPDSMLAFVIDGYTFVRRHSERFQLLGDRLLSQWSPFAGITVTTELIPQGRGHIRRHTVQSDVACTAYDCGFAVPKFCDGFAAAAEGASAEACNAAQRCVVTGQGGGAGVIVDAWPNTSLYAANTVIPAVRYDIPAGACELTTRVESWSR
ncbi:MAG TPA: DUF2264 domain-containing protein [Candidatus Gemmiger avistercoris]|uniref:DUF2264 domain-containing protein n=1 Tax=Candidatus Gemmiger avistercoris TaxID=2838606 RepID=A0A9D2JP50_9FIRM|nr:DUF2264 domain-containing protein [uncultured Subdoligranulum sp.]HIZ62016.1 DUF2264 domain-containing protein [Candidatus Gemmiger avistercoris]